MSQLPLFLMLALRLAYAYNQTVLIQRQIKLLQQSKKLFLTLGQASSQRSLLQDFLRA